VRGHYFGAKWERIVSAPAQYFFVCFLLAFNRKETFLHPEIEQVYLGALVSVVIPTLGRPEWAVRAVHSALTQSYAQVEVVIIVDGPDYETAHGLEQFRDERVRVLMLEKNVGGAEARNIGVRMARGEWIAFLDDDDFWLPDKLEKQMALATSLQVRFPVIGAAVLVNESQNARVLPRRLYRHGEDVSEYLFCRKSFVYGEGVFHTSTLLTRRELLLEVPFTAGLQRHQDWDWLLRISGRRDVAFAMLPNALTVMRMAEGEESVSRSLDWIFSLKWAQNNRRHMSPRAYSFFVTTECVTRARKSGAGLSVYLQLLAECFWRGRLETRQLLLFLGFWLIPEQTRRELRNRMLQASMEHEA
jgi:glycosyltransferase involved in cell wall biosynthesis